MTTWNTLDDISFSLNDTTLMTELLAASPKSLPSPREKQRLALQAHRQRQKDELEYLKKAVDELQEQLHRLNQVHELQDILRPPTYWEKLAKDECKKQIEVVNENRRLKRAIEEQVEFAESLANLVHKKPRLELFSTAESDAWKHFRLVKDPETRYAAFHAITDRDYAFVDSVMIQARLIDATTDHRKVFPIVQNDIVEIHSYGLMRQPVDFISASVAIWDVFRGVAAVPRLSGSYKCLAKIDENTSYVEGYTQLTKFRIQRRLVVKRYIESPTRIVILSRSIHEDESLPLDPSLSIAQEVTWLVFEKIGDDSVAKYYRKSRSPVNTPTQVLSHEDAASECALMMELCDRHTKSFENTVLELVAQKSPPLRLMMSL
ncbi:hypothetical protein THRCLA_11801 [Thraustotheca clavata]|uniref:M96 mating-specific protein family n=1 Tax=Thraustotheca clavata TaxID=74557 RepID=A0A1V9Y6L1_9STRA|nr:hypothetical protein THRCLA_11801 [Thraustotheca clavata]